jgi:hypothetical protein
VAEAIQMGVRGSWGNSRGLLAVIPAKSRQAALTEMQRAAARRVVLSTIAAVHFQP